MINVVSKRYWQVYSLLLLITTAVRTVERLATDVGGLVSNFLPILLAFLVTYGIHACTHRKAVLNQYLWRLTSWILLVAVVLGMVFGTYWLIKSGFANRGGLILITYSVFLIPAFYKIWQYGYRLPSIWHLYS